MLIYFNVYFEGSNLYYLRFFYLKEKKGISFFTPCFPAMFEQKRSIYLPNQCLLFSERSIKGHYNHCTYVGYQLKSLFPNKGIRGTRWKQVLEDWLWDGNWSLWRKWKWPEIIAWKNSQDLIILFFPPFLSPYLLCLMYLTYFISVDWTLSLIPH